MGLICTYTFTMARIATGLRTGGGGHRFAAVPSLFSPGVGIDVWPGIWFRKRPQPEQHFPACEEHLQPRPTVPVGSVDFPAGECVRSKRQMPCVKANDH